MNSICVDNEEGGVAWLQTFAKVTCMVELDLKPDGFQGDVGKS